VGFVVDKAHWGRFSPSTSASPAKNSINCSTLIIIRGWYNRPIVASVIADSFPQQPKEGRILQEKVQVLVVHELAENCCV
jgi:hypothetical protein